MADLTAASFFSGIGLLDLGLEWAGWRTVSFSEIDKYASRVLDARFPGVPNLGDLHAIEHVPDATLWAGGFPCQPISSAGKRLGQADPRWLWPVWAQLIRQFRPPYILLENVSALLAVNDGRGFGEVLGDLAESGYDAEWDCIPASALGAPHRRDRIWIVAHANGGEHPGGLARGTDGSEGLPVEPHPHVAYVRSLGPDGLSDAASGNDGHGDDPGRQEEASRAGERRAAVSDAHRGRLQPGSQRQAIWRVPKPDPRRHGSGNGWWAAEPNVGRMVDGVPHRVDRLRCLGNGVVPQVAEWVGWRIREAIEMSQVAALRSPAPEEPR